MSEVEQLNRDVPVAARLRKVSGSARGTRLMRTIVIVGLLPLAAAHGQQENSEILSILADMVGQEYQFKPDRLHGMGVEGLSAVLDELLPDTAEPKNVDLPEDTIARLIDQLADSLVHCLSE